MRPITDRNTPDQAGAREAMHEARPIGRRASCWRVGTKRDRAAVVDQPEVLPVCSTGHISRSDTVCKMFALWLWTDLHGFHLLMFQDGNVSAIFLENRCWRHQILLNINRGIIDLGNQRIPFSDNRKDLGMRDVLFWRKCCYIKDFTVLLIDWLNFSK